MSEKLIERLENNGQCGIPSVYYVCRDAVAEIARLTRELAEARLQRDGLVEWAHVWDDRAHCRCCDGHPKHKPNCKLKAALDAAKGGV